MLEDRCHDLLLVGSGCCDALFSSPSFRAGAFRVLELLANNLAAEQVALVVDRRLFLFPQHGEHPLPGDLEAYGFSLFSSEREGVKTVLGVKRKEPLEEEERLLVSTLCKQLGIAHAGFKKRQEAEGTSRRMRRLYEAVTCLGKAMNLRGLVQEIARSAYEVVSPQLVRVKVQQGDRVTECVHPPDRVPKRGYNKASFPIIQSEDTVGSIEVFTQPTRKLSRTDRRILRLLVEISHVFFENIVLFQKLNTLLHEKERQISHLSILYELGNAYRLTSNPAKRIRLLLQGLTDAHRGLGFEVALYFSAAGNGRFTGELGVLPQKEDGWAVFREGIGEIKEPAGSNKVVPLQGIELSLEGVTPPSVEDPFPLPREILPRELGFEEDLRFMGIPSGTRSGEIEGFVVVGKRGKFSKAETRILAMMVQQASLAIASAQSQSTIKELDREFKDAQARFLEAERMATLGELSARIAHDLKNPLIAIGGLAKKLHKKMADDHPDKRYLEAIIKEVEESERILSNVLGYARKPVKIKRSVDINLIVDELLFLFAEELRDRRVVLVKHLERGIPEVEVDPGQIRQVLTNLISNALDAMSSLEHGVLKVRSSQKVSDGERWVCIEIEDSGGGIPEDVLPAIFKPFFSTKSRGTGLGLAIAKRIVEELHGGKIEVRNNPPHGTTFAVYLPISKENQRNGAGGSKA